MSKAINIYPIVERAVNRANYLKTPIVLEHIDFQCEEDGLRSEHHLACEHIEDDTLFDTLRTNLEKFAKKYPDYELNPNCVEFHYDIFKTKKSWRKGMRNIFKIVDATVTIFPKAEIEAYYDGWKMMKDTIKQEIRSQGVDCYCEYVK